MRGENHSHGKHSSRICGLIPACAGKTNWSPHLQRARRAHPRMRGENHTCRKITLPTRGSSPHARGKLGVWFWRWFGCGLIPACAGKTVPKKIKILGTRAHPRMRGENSSPPGNRLKQPGSSPHARGKPLTASAVVPPKGLIPACAGKTLTATGKA